MFQRFLRDRIAGQFGLAVEGGDMIPTRDNNGVGVDAGKPIEFNETRAAGEVNALQTLLENRYMNKVRRQPAPGRSRRRGRREWEAIVIWGNAKDLCATVSDHGETPKAKGEPEVL